MASPATGQSGEATALAAVVKGSAEQHAPADGWVATVSGVDAQTFVSGTYMIHVVRLADGTWIADSGSSCGAASMYPSPGLPSVSASPAP